MTDVIRVKDQVLVMSFGPGTKQMPVFDPGEGARFRWLSLPEPLGGLGRADEPIGVSLGELLAERMREETGYEAAMRRFLSRRPTRLKNEGESYPDRDQLHERALLR